MMNSLGNIDNLFPNQNDSQTNSQNSVKCAYNPLPKLGQSLIKPKKLEPSTPNSFEESLQTKEIDQEPKDKPKNSNNLKDKLEDLNSVIDLILMSLQTPAQQTDTNLNPPETTNINTDDYSTDILVSLDTKLSDGAEALIKDIANIDLGSENAIQDILKLSDVLEAINDLKAQTQALMKDLNIQPTNSDSKELEPEMNLLIEDKLEKFISKYTETTLEAKPEHKTGPNVVFDDTEVELLQNDSPETSTDSNSSNEAEPQADDKFLLSELNKTTFTQTPSANSKTEPVVIKEPVNVNKLTHFLNDRIIKIDNGKHEEIILKLSPGDLGDIRLSIARQGAKIEIQMEFSRQDSLDTVEHRLAELQTTLRAKGFDTEIKVSTTSSSDLNSNQQQQQSSFNEAKDEQKEKFLHTLPSWLKDRESDMKTSFQDTLGGILG